MNYEEKFAERSVSFSPQALWDTGLDPSQTSLKIDAYSLACLPYRFSMRNAVLLASITPDEAGFFQRFKGGLAGLGLAFNSHEQSSSGKIFCRCQLDTIGMMKGRDNLGLIALSWKPIPPDLALRLGRHLENEDGLRADYAAYRGRSVPVRPDTAKLIGFNNYAIMSTGGSQLKPALFSIGVDRVEFLLPLRSPDIAPGADCGFSLFFQRYRFSVKGVVESGARLPSGVLKATASLEYSPELVQLLSEYFKAH
jgi:hypothetical protein